MYTIQTLLLIGHVMIATLLVGLVLLQRGKGAEAGAGFGSGASGTVFGAKGSASFLTRTTAVLATLFFVSSMVLAYLGGRQEPPGSLLESTAPDMPAVIGTPVENDSVVIEIDDLPDLPGSSDSAGGAGSETSGSEPSE
jgi:preprotein translocase subunit SecG